MKEFINKNNNRNMLQYSTMLSLIIIILSIFTRVYMSNSIISDLTIFTVFVVNLIRRRELFLSSLKVKLILWYAMLTFISIISIILGLSQPNIFFYHYIVAILYIVTFSLIITSKYEIKLVSKIIVYTTLIISFLSVCQYLGRVFGISLGTNFLYIRKGIMRVSGLYGNPNYFAISLLVSLGIVLRDLGEKKSYLSIATYLFLILTLILTFSRGAYISLVAINGLFLILNYKYLKRFNNKKVVLLAFIMVAISIFYLISNNGYFLEKMTDMFNPNSNPRYITWRIGLTEFWSSSTLKILFGLGADSVTKIPENILKLQPHNSYVKILVENGLIGFLMYLYFFFEIVRSNIKIKNQVNPFLYSLVALIIMGFSNDVFHLKEFSLVVSLFFILGGIPIHIKFGERRKITDNI